MSKAKTIIMVQHTQSVHHTNRHAGAWGDWELTELGHSQAAAIGQYLLGEGCAEGYTMYVSDLKRAFQTAEEINRSLGLTPIVTDVIREVNAGAGNGHRLKAVCRRGVGPRPVEPPVSILQGDPRERSRQDPHRFARDGAQLPAVDADGADCGEQDHIPVPGKIGLDLAV